jgi:hypothetical protein
MPTGTDVKNSEFAASNPDHPAEPASGTYKDDPPDLDETAAKALPMSPAEGGPWKNMRGGPSGE